MNSCIWIFLLLFCCNGTNGCGCGNLRVGDRCGCERENGRGRERNDSCDRERGDRRERRERDCDDGRGRERNDGCGCGNEQSSRPMPPPPPRPPRPPFEDCGCN